MFILHNGEHMEVELKFKKNTLISALRTKTLNIKEYVISYVVSLIM